MIDTKAEVEAQGGKVAMALLSGNYPVAAVETAKLLAMLGALVVPPIEPASLDPGDRAAVDAEIDAEIGKP